MDFVAPQISREKPFGILFVCPGNICRSPALGAALQKIIKEQKLEHKIFVDSCASTAYYTGCDADPRVCDLAHKRGLHIDHRVKLFEHEFFNHYQLILAVNRETLETLLTWASTHQQRQKIHLACEFSRRFPFQDIPDPYYGQKMDFENVLDIAEDVAGGVLKFLESFLHNQTEDR